MNPLDKIIEIIAEYCVIDAAELSSDSVLAELGDSLDLMEILIEVEDEFEVILQKSDKCKTIGELAAQVEVEITK